MKKLKEYQKKIQEKEKKFKRNQELKKEERNMSIKKQRSCSERRNKNIFTQYKFENQNQIRKSKDLNQNMQTKMRDTTPEMKNTNLEITLNSKILKLNSSSSRLDSQEYNCSPSVIYPSATKNIFNLDTPDNYCPIMNTQIKNTCQE